LGKPAISCGACSTEIVFHSVFEEQLGKEESEAISATDEHRSNTDGTVADNDASSRILSGEDRPATD
jgi:hypothetical protein